MSVYIKGMEMPTSCYECPCNKDDGFGFFTCGVTKSECDFISLPPDCPLIPVLDHGRLIDADAAVANRNVDTNWCYDLSDLPDYLAGCPTIIPADKEVEE